MTSIPGAPGPMNCGNATLFEAGGYSASLSFLLNNYEVGDPLPPTKRFCQHRKKILKERAKERK